MKINFSINDQAYQIDMENGSSYVLSAKGVNQDKDSKNFGEDTSKVVGHFTRIVPAVNKAIRETLADSTDEITLKEFIERYEQANQSVLDQIGDK
jgi:hypothetical protein